MLPRAAGGDARFCSRGHAGPNKASAQGPRAARRRGRRAARARRARVLLARQPLICHSGARRAAAPGAAGDGGGGGGRASGCAAKRGWKGHRGRGRPAAPPLRAPVAPSCGPGRPKSHPLGPWPPGEEGGFGGGRAAGVLSALWWRAPRTEARAAKAARAGAHACMRVHAAGSMRRAHCQVSRSGAPPLRRPQLLHAFRLTGVAPKGCRSRCALRTRERSGNACAPCRLGIDRRQGCTQCGPLPSPPGARP